MSDGQNPNLRQKVQDWLHRQGYPLEMRAARAFKKRRWHLHHSRRYTDPFTGKEREVDLIAFNDVNGALVAGHAVVECKWSPDKPWVLFAAATRALTSVGHFHSTPMTEAAKRMTEVLVNDDMPGFPLFADREEGYMLVQARLSQGAGKDDGALDAAHTATLAAMTAADFTAARMSEATNYAIVYVPTIVVDGELYRCSLDDDGDVVVTEIDMGFLIHHTADDQKCMHVVREAGLERFIDMFEETFTSMNSLLRDRLVER
jgi:hypothetical protein